MAVLTPEKQRQRRRETNSRVLKEIGRGTQRQPTVNTTPGSSELLDRLNRIERSVRRLTELLEELKRDANLGV